MTRRDCHVASLLTITTFLFSFNAQATCTPTPDCASIGYTETSCEGDSLKCPFDISKLYCIPCDSTFKYDCSGQYVTNKIGNTCANKYVHCECVKGAILGTNTCECPNLTTTNCTVGTIYYPDGSCSNDYVACLNPVGVVVKDNALVMSWRRNFATSWASNVTTDTSLTNMSKEQAKVDYNGKSNTAVIVSSYPDDTIDNNAAIYCNEYAPTGMESSKGQWYLPAAGELYDYVYGHYNTLLNIYKTHLGYSSFSYWFWSSSEYDYANAYYVSSSSDFMSIHGKYHNHQVYSVSCFLAIN